MSVKNFCPHFPKVVNHQVEKKNWDRQAHFSCWYRASRIFYDLRIIVHFFSAIAQLSFGALDIFTSIPVMTFGEKIICRGDFKWRTRSKRFPSETTIELLHNAASLQHHCSIIAASLQQRLLLDNFWVLWARGLKIFMVLKYKKVTRGQLTFFWSNPPTTPTTLPPT